MPNFRYKLLNYDLSESEQLSKNFEGQMEKLTCFIVPKDVMYAQIFNKDFMIQFLNDAIQLGESKAYEKMAFSVYEIVQQHGFNPDFDPNDC